MIPVCLGGILADAYGKAVLIHGFNLVSFSRESVILEVEIQLPGEEISKVPVKITK